MANKQLKDFTNNTTPLGADTVYTASSANSFQERQVTITNFGTALTKLGTITTGVWNATPIGLSYGGTNANLTPSNGGIFYSTATAGAILSGTATARQMLQSGASGAPAWSTATYPATTTINQILYSSTNNAVSGLSTGNNGVLVTDGSGVPSINTTIPGGLTVGGSGAFQTINDIQLDDGVGNTVVNSLNAVNSLFAQQAMTTGSSIYFTGTIGQSGNTITGSGTTFTSQMVGGLLKWTSGGLLGTYALITGFTNATTITVDNSSSQAGGQTFEIFYTGLSSLNGPSVGFSNCNVYGSPNFRTSIQVQTTGSNAATIVNASLAAARTYTIPDAGANANFVMSNLVSESAGIVTIGDASATNIVGQSTTGGQYLGSSAKPFGFLFLGSSTNYVPFNVSTQTTNGQQINVPDLGTQPQNFIVGSTAAVVTTSQTMAKWVTYFANNASQVNFTLPTVAQGDTFVVIGQGAGGFKISQLSGQSIKISGTDITTTTGTGGSIQSTNQYDSCMLIAESSTVLVARYFGTANVT